MKESLLLLKPYRMKFTNLLLQYQNVYIDKLYDIINKYNNTYHSTINKKPVDVNSSTYLYLNK